MTAEPITSAALAAPAPVHARAADTAKASSRNAIAALLAAPDTINPNRHPTTYWPVIPHLNTVTPENRRTSIRYH